MIIKQIISYGTLFGYNTKFSRIASEEIYDPQLEIVGVTRVTFLVKSVLNSK